MSRFWMILFVVVLAANCFASPATEPEADFAADDYPLAIKGYCPVTLLVERKWKRGDARFGALHRRRTFLFASEAEQKTFLEEPDRYTPVLTGYDIVKFVRTGEFIDGSHSHALTFRKQVYLFVDEASLEAFMQDPAKVVEDAREAMLRAERKGPLR